MRPSQSADFAIFLKSAGSRPTASDLQAKKKAALGSATWMRIDTEGDTMMLEADKYAIMHRSIKAIVTADEVLLRNAKSEDVIPFIDELRRRLAVPGRAVTPTVASDVESEGSDHENHEGERIPLRGANQQKSRSPSPLRENQHEEMSEGEDEEQPPFEFVALEVALEFVCTFLDARTTELENAAYPALDALTSKVSSLNLERVRKLKNGLSRLLARVQKVREEIERLLDDDDDMADMFLTRKAAVPLSPTASDGGPPSVPPSPTIASRISRGAGSRGTFSTFASDDNDVEELEQLLEAYFGQVEGTLNKLNTLREYIDDTEDYINIQLDNHRNQLIQLELVLNTATVTVAIFSVVAGIFGMNIPYHWNEDERAFKWVVIISTIACVSIFVGLVTYARYRRIIS